MWSCVFFKIGHRQKRRYLTRNIIIWTLVHQTFPFYRGNQLVFPKRFCSNLVGFLLSVLSLLKTKDKCHMSLKRLHWYFLFIVTCYIFRWPRYCTFHMRHGHVKAALHKNGSDVPQVPHAILTTKQPPSNRRPFLDNLYFVGITLAV
jgi:hypothetical protein